MANLNLGLGSADPLRISPENEGGGPVISQSIVPCAATSIFRRHCHQRHWPFFVAVAVGVAAAVGMAVGVASVVVRVVAVARARAVAVAVELVRAVAGEWR